MLAIPYWPSMSEWRQWIQLSRLLPKYGHNNLSNYLREQIPIQSLSRMLSGMDSRSQVWQLGRKIGCRSIELSALRLRGSGAGGS